jgi:hypothetical protein
MSKTKVLLVGAAGETGGSIANGLLDTGDFVRLPALSTIEHPVLINSV